MADVYQSFRSGDDTIVRIQAAVHPVSGVRFVIWSDIAHCFPGVARIQHGDVFVPLLRNERLYRIKPHGIKYHPDAILDVIYNQDNRVAIRSRVTKHVPVIEPSSISRPEEATAHKTTISAAIASSSPLHSSDVDSATSPKELASSTKSTTMADQITIPVESTIPAEPTIAGGDQDTLAMERGRAMFTQALNDAGMTIEDVNAIIDKHIYKALEAMRDPNGAYSIESIKVAKIPKDIKTMVTAELTRMVQGAAKSMPVEARRTKATKTTTTTVANKEEENGEREGGEKGGESALEYGQGAKVTTAAMELQRVMHRLIRLETENVILRSQSSPAFGPGDIQSIPTPTATTAISTAATTNAAASTAIAAAITSPAGSNQGTEEQGEGSEAPQNTETDTLTETGATTDVTAALTKFMELCKTTSARIQTLQTSASSLSDTTIATEAADSSVGMKGAGDLDQEATDIEPSDIRNGDDDDSNVNSHGGNAGAIVKVDQPIGTDPLVSTSADAQQPQHANGARKSPFSSLDIVKHRMKDIRKKRYTWLESPCPKLFIILPTDPEVTSFPHQTWADFDLHFLCDCGEIPRLDGEDVCHICNTSMDDVPYCGCAPHLMPEANGFPQQKDLLKFGNYMMAILEMLEYGSRVEGTEVVPMLKDMKDRKKVMYSMVFLMKQGIETSHQLLAKGFQALDQIKPVAPLTEADLMDLYRMRINERRPFQYHNPIQTLSGDIRWVCHEHYMKLTPDMTTLFENYPASSHLAYERALGTFVVTLNNAERARALYTIAAKMAATPVISIFLDWDLNTADESDLEKAISTFSASCVKICVRERDEDRNPEIDGFGYGFFKVMMAGLANLKIQAFSIERQNSGETNNNEVVDEFFASKGPVFMDPVLIRYTRELEPPRRVQLGIMVTDLDKAAISFMAAVTGFNGISKLTLEAGYGKHIEIDFRVDRGENGDDGGNDEAETGKVDVDNNPAEDMVEFFNRRKQDAITLRIYNSTDTIFLKTHVLRDINIRIAFPEDGPRIRELIKNNRQLTKMEFSIDSKDDPCQVFEYFKAVMNDHPSLESLHLRKDWGKNNKSTFVWHGVSDRSKMTLSIMSYAEDKIGTLLQKFGACLLQIFIHSINIQDSLILEKVTRSRKSQLKLMTISLVDVFQISLTALDELAKVVLRVPLARFMITGTVNPRTASRVGEFMTTVATRITDIHFYGEQTKAILTELTKRMPESSHMDLLIELKLSGPFDATTKDLTWIRSVLFKPIPLATIELHKVNLSHQGWMTLAQEIDFKRLEYFRVGPDVPLKIEAVKAFVGAVPPKSELENFHLDSLGLNELHCRVYKATVLEQLRKKTALVSIGRYY
ncbi:hypothetical protein EDD21DRAFT_443526 [Dissophora ornata]|nr:hypothetical protein BGZ58_006920 [Dissophora ornata]KAI8601644.1 hypothetical protein EDD21DRAFT_443526 [Dissophora ornata]